MRPKKNRMVQRTSRNIWDELLYCQRTVSVVISPVVLSGISSHIDHLGQFTDVVCLHIVPRPSCLILAIAELPAYFSSFTTFAVTFYGVPPRHNTTVSVKTSALPHLIKFTNKQPVIFTIEGFKLYVFDANSKTLLWCSQQCVDIPKVYTLSHNVQDNVVQLLTVDTNSFVNMINAVALGECIAKVTWTGVQLQLESMDHDRGNVLVTMEHLSTIPEFAVDVYIKHLFLFAQAAAGDHVHISIRNDCLVCASSTPERSIECCLQRASIVFYS